MDAALVILDGWGIARPDATGRLDAVAAADTPTIDALTDHAASGQLTADGETVGLPAGQMGNSQVGHLTIGAGRVVEQASSRITAAVEEGSLGDNPAIAGAIEQATAAGGRVHLWGLLSDGGVHASAAHLHALVDLVDAAGLEAVVHAVTDGRDTPPRSANVHVPRLQRRVDACERASIATVVGRYFAMDRDANWGRTYRAYEAMVHGRGTRRVADAKGAVEAAYAVGESDEFVSPTVVDGAEPIAEGDAVVLANFRADRARQLTRMLVDIDPVWSPDTDPPPVELVTLAEYDRTFDVPVAFDPIEPTATLGSVLADAGKTQLRIAESEKYPHVTYFLNGGREVTYPGEIREIVPSPAVATYDRQPAMSAPAVTDRTLAIVEADDPDVVILNYANPDMVGHTGVFEAVVEAVEAVDAELGRLLEGLPPCHALVIADHGNAEDMGTPSEPHTAHTTNPVPFVYRDPTGGDGGFTVRDGGTLADVTPTVLELVGLEVPAEMTGSTLLVHQD